MRVLVTGGAGFIGRHFCHDLARQDIPFVIVDALDPQVHGDSLGSDIVTPGDSEFVRGDYANIDPIFLRAHRITHVVHLAAQVGVGQSMYEPSRYLTQNTVGTGHFMNALRAYGGVEQLVVASSMSVYGEGRYICTCRTGAHYVYPEQNNKRRFEMPCPACGREMQPSDIPEDIPLNPCSVYGISKLDQEMLCRVQGKAYGIPTIALRFFNVYGEGQALGNPYTGAIAIFANQIMNGECPTVFEDGLQTRDFIHVSDIVQGLNHAMWNEHGDDGVCNLGTGVGTTMLDVAVRLNDLLGGPGVKTTGEFREGDVRHGRAFIYRARRALGFEPTVAIGEGLARTVEWMREQGPQHVVSEAHVLRANGLLRS